MKKHRDDELEKRYTSWSTKDLVRATGIEKGDYEPGAIAIMLKELNRRGISHGDIEIVQNGIEREVKDEGEKCSGIGGLLLLFLVILFFNLILIFIQIFLTIPEIPYHPWYYPLSASYIITGAYGVYVFLLLIWKKQSAPAHTIKWLILTCLLGILNAAFVILDGGKLDYSVVGIPIFALIWLTYFFKSKRVIITYNAPKGR